MKNAKRMARQIDHIMRAEEGDRVKLVAIDMIVSDFANLGDYVYPCNDQDDDRAGVLVTAAQREH